MSAWLWSLFGLVVSIVTLYLYVVISPAYKRGEHFSLPILPFAVIVILHLFAAFTSARYIAYGIDALMLLWAATFRIIAYADRKKR